MSQKIEFKPDTHQYFINGIEYPSVTKILSSLTDFSFVDRDLLRRAAAFGTAVHKATELYDNNSLDLDSLDPILLPYVEAWDNFLQDYKPEILSAEQIIASQYGYAGTLDRYCLINNQRVIIDIKSGTIVPKYTGLQLAAYGQAINEGGGIVDKRWVVHLLPCKYDVHEHNDGADFLTFKSALNLFRWSQAHG